MESLLQINKCILCKNECYCQLFLDAHVKDIEKRKNLITKIIPILNNHIKSLDMIISDAVPILNLKKPNILMKCNISHIFTCLPQSVVISIMPNINKHIMHDSFLKLLSILLVPLSQILCIPEFAKKLAGFSIKLTHNTLEINEAMFRLYAGFTKTVIISINLAQEKHYDENGKFKQGGISKAYYDEIVALTSAPFTDIITALPIQAGTPAFYFKCDLPLDKIPIAYYTQQTVDQLNGISPFTRIRFTAADICKIIVPTKDIIHDMPYMAVIGAQIPNNELLDKTTNNCELLSLVRSQSDTNGINYLNHNIIKLYRAFSTPCIN
jgi:hypothetical protein